MIFGEIKGFGADRSVRHALVVVCLIAAIYCMLGFISGMIEVDADFDKRLKPFAWDTARIIYLAGEVVASGAGIWFALTYREPGTRLGATLILALPIAIVATMAAGLTFGWLQ